MSFRKTVNLFFSGGRKRSENLIPILLDAGPELWHCDIQYYIDKGF